MVSVETPHRLSLAIFELSSGFKAANTSSPYVRHVPLGAINPIRQAAPLLRPPARKNYHKPLRQTRSRTANKTKTAADPLSHRSVLGLAKAGVVTIRPHQQPRA